MLSITVAIEGWPASHRERLDVLEMVPVSMIKKDLEGPSLNVGPWLCQVKRFGLALGVDRRIKGSTMQLCLVLIFG